MKYFCIDCGEEREITKKSFSRKKFKSLCFSCAALRIDKNYSDNPNWKGGQFIKNGYRYVIAKGHPLANSIGYIKEHRLVAAEKWGIFAVMNSLVHHIDGDKLNNHPDNLEIVSGNWEHFNKHRSANSKYQKHDEDNYLIKCECGCGSEFMKYGKDRSPRRFFKLHRARKNKTAYWNNPK